ncbi:MAG: UDP-N-acetylmuramoyl-L-alanine--D-glutamate ligase [Tahibacter sp.]
MRFSDLAGRRVAVWGYGREGKAALAALRRRLPGQRLSLLCSESEAELAATLYGDSLECISVEPYAGLLWTFDVIVKSPGVSAYHAALREAVAAGVVLTSGTALWFGENPAARVIAVTGTKGKSTTTALIAHLLRELGRRVALVGNIGMPLLELLDTPALVDWWVVELSSFQTGEMGQVDVGLINNIYEEHLDWHGSRDRYVADKLRLADASRLLVANGLQSELVERTAEHPNRHLFGTVAGWHVAEGSVCWRERRCLDTESLPIPGEHNALNLCAALTVLDAIGADSQDALASVTRFAALPHRLQTLGSRDGLRWINDSISTTPQATIEALRSLDRVPVTVLLGGFDRGVDWQDFVHFVRQNPPHAVIAMGANGARIAALLADTATDYLLRRCGSLGEAVALARELTPAAGVVLLSPGAPSFDQFKDYADRGRAFAQLAGFDPQAIVGIQGLGVA